MSQYKMTERNPFGYSCPKCGGIKINISASAPCTVYLRTGGLNNGGYDYGQDNGPEWEDGDFYSCLGCSHEGQVKELICDGLDVDDLDVDDEEDNAD
jgi:hypothetical protein